MKSALVKINYICNNNCLFCFENKNNKEISLEKFEDLIHSLKKQDIDNIILSGGEPTIHPDIKKMIETIKKNTLSFEIITNGRMLSNKKICNIIEDAKKIHITFLSHKEENQNILTNTNDGFKQTVRGILNIKNKKKIIINLIITKYNQNNFDKDILFLKKLGIKNIKISLVFKGKMNVLKFNNIKPNLDTLHTSINTLIKEVNKDNLTVEGLPICFFNFEKERDTLIRKIVDKRYELENESTTSTNKTYNDERKKPLSCKLWCPSYKYCEGIYIEYYNDLVKILKDANINKTP